jgi:ribosomal protein L32
MSECAQDCSCCDWNINPRICRYCKKYKAVPDEVDDAICFMCQVDREREMQKALKMPMLTEDYIIGETKNV